MTDSPESSIASVPPLNPPSDAAPFAGTATRRRGTRLEQALSGAARAAINRGEALVQIRTTIKVGKPKRAAKLPCEPKAGVMLNPEQIELSRWANRHEQSYCSCAFVELKRSIQHDGGNQVPILVRPLRLGAGASSLPQYELAYGHRRLRACRELGLPVKAIVEELTEGRLVERMHAENREREGLSAYEAGVFYKRLMDAGLYPSKRKMAEALGVDQADATRKIWLASLPAEIIQVFRPPLDVSCDDVRRLQPVWNRDPAEMQRQASELLNTDGPLPAKQAIARLIAAAASTFDGGSIRLDEVQASANQQCREVVEIHDSGSDGMTIRLNTRLNAADRQALRLQIETFLSARRVRRESAQPAEARTALSLPG